MSLFNQCDVTSNYGGIFFNQGPYFKMWHFCSGLNASPFSVVFILPSWWKKVFKFKPPPALKDASNADKFDF